MSITLALTPGHRAAVLNALLVLECLILGTEETSDRIELNREVAALYRRLDYRLPTVSVFELKMIGDALQASIANAAEMANVDRENGPEYFDILTGAVGTLQSLPVVRIPGLN